MSSDKLTVCIGVDGGGTSTRAMSVHTLTGEPLGAAGLSGSSNRNSVGNTTAALSIIHALYQSLRNAGVLSALAHSGGVLADYVDSALLSMSGADRPLDQALIAHWTRTAISAPLATAQRFLDLAAAAPPAEPHALTAVLRPLFSSQAENEVEDPFAHPPTSSSSSVNGDVSIKPRVEVASDAVAALCAGTSGELFGAVVISGTGMVVFCFSHGGASSRAGGWGPLLGEPCSGYTIGARVLAAVTAAADGVAPQTALREGVLRSLGLGEESALIEWAYADVAWARFARLAAVAFECYEGDAVARGIVDEEVGRLLDTLEAAVRAIGFPEGTGFPVVCSGGNFTHEGSVLLRVFSERFAERQRHGALLKHGRIALPSISAEQAAALLARNKLKSQQ